MIFDVDGTLVDSVAIHAEAWQEAFAAFGHDIPFEKLRGQIGKGATNGGGFPDADLNEAGCIAIFGDPADLLARYEDFCERRIEPDSSPLSWVACRRQAGDGAAV